MVTCGGAAGASGALASCAQLVAATPAANAVARAIRDAINLNFGAAPIIASFKTHLVERRSEAASNRWRPLAADPLASTKTQKNDARKTT
jgi:hypothetical protein